MGLRVLVIIAVWAAMPAAVAHSSRPRVDATVHDGTICWDPDVEFPVPCDDDDD
jgi:hypothetical protein